MGNNYLNSLIKCTLITVQVGSYGPTLCLHGHLNTIVCKGKVFCAPRHLADKTYRERWGRSTHWL